MNEPLDQTATQNATVSGTVADNSEVMLTINGQPLAINLGEMFSSQIDLPEGAQQIRFAATDAIGNRSEIIRSVTIDRTPPVIGELSPAEGSIADSPTTVRGRATDATAVIVNVNGVAATVGSGGLFAAENVEIAEGENQVLITAVDAAGNDSTAVLSIRGRDQTPPPTPTLFSVISPTRLAFQTIEGRAESGAQVAITGGAESVTVNVAFGTGLFATTVKLVTGANTLTVTARDAEGNSSPGAQLSITSDPTLQLPPAGQAAQINISTGNAQKGLVNTELPRPLIAIVTDRNGTPVSSIAVQFTVQEGDGRFIGGSDSLAATTDAQGHASVRYTSGAGAGPQQIRADFTGNTMTPAIFLAETLEASAEGETSVSGVVLDQNLRALPHVLVRIGGQQGRTGTDGRFLLKNIASGRTNCLS
ncbi:MAG: Ig-like domain-containing protein [Pyrinomonadaceae bacterium]